MAHPAWLAAIEAGANLFAYDSGGKLGGMFNDFRWDLQRLLRWTPVGMIGLIAWAALLRSVQVGKRRSAGSWLVVLLTAGMVLFWLQSEQVRYWWPAALLLVLALLLVQIMARPRPVLELPDRREGGLWLLLLSLPFAFSFGTNMPVLWHSQAAALFVVLLLVVRLERLWQEGNLTTPMMGAALCLLCAPPLVFQLRAAFDPAYVYRLANSLMMQREPWKTPVGTVWVDEDTKRALADLQNAAQKAGLSEGESIMDFTGDGPGLVLALSGRPLGVPWLVGGYPDSARWAERLVQSLPSTKLQAAWLLSSPDNPRGIVGWSEMLTRKVGPSSHELVATLTVRAPSLWGKGAAPKATLCLWRPLNRTLSGARKAPSLIVENSCQVAME
jgi:hypothetical protein